MTSSSAGRFLTFYFEEVSDCLGRDRLGTGFPGEYRDGTRYRHFGGGGLQPLANEPGDHFAETFMPFVRDVFGEAEQVFVDIEGGAHKSIMML